METQNRFRFSIGNLLWMMVPLAIIFAAFGLTSSKMHPDAEGVASFCKGASLALGLPAAVGALWGGSRGMLRAIRGSFIWCGLTLAILTLFILAFALLVIAIDFIISIIS